MKDLGGSFWQFSVQFYGSERVAATCLNLQDQWGLDVNLLLYCLWQGGRERRLARRTLEAACRASAAWRQNVVQPLRSARRWMKARSEGVAADAAPLRERIKALELAAEKQQQDWLSQLAVAYETAPQPRACAGNLALYLEVEEIASAPDLTEGLLTLIAEALPGAEEDALAEARAALGGAQGRRPRKPTG